MSESGVHVVFAGGGTGGHLFPTLAVAERLATVVGARTTWEFLCSSRAIDSAILTRAGARFTATLASPPGVRPRAAFRFLRGWGASVRLARRAIGAARKSGKRVVLVASGGFVAAPLAQGARVEKCPILMLNLDAVPGKANRWIGRFADRILTTAAVGEGAGAAWTRIPPIVRASIPTGSSPAECRRALGLDPQSQTLLVTGGSQGASSINRFMAAFAGVRGSYLSGWQVLHQTGTSGDEELEAAYRSAGVRALVTEFLADMGSAWGAAELCVCRAGAGNVGEAWATRTPSLFMPYPYHKDGHQRANAMPLVEAGAAVLVRDAVDPAVNLEEAGAALAELLTSPASRDRLRAGLERLGPADGAERVAREVAALAGLSG